ncbi:MAG: hypothetical protein WCS69_06050 [Ignavibacteriaceae bacterium]|jgi:hypothetical protein
MKNKYIIFTIIGFLAGAVLTSCNIDREKKVADAKENVQQANQDLKEAQAQYDKEWQQFKSDAEFRIRTNENRIDEFKAEIKTASGKFKAKYEKEVVVLEQKNIELKKKISGYKYEGKDQWEEFKRGFNHDMDVVGETLNDLFTKKD